MSASHIALRTLLRIRHNEKQKSERNLGQAVGSCNVILAKLDQLQHEQQNIIAHYSQNTGRSMSKTMPQLYFDREEREVVARYLQRIGRQRHTHMQALHSAQAHLKLQQEEYRHAYCAHAAFEQIYHQRLRVHQTIARRKIQHHYDEIASYRWQTTAQEIISPI